MIEDVKPQMDRVRFLDMSQATPRHTIVAQHASSSTPSRRGSRAAVKAMQDHLSEILLSLPEMAAQYPDLFEPEHDVGSRHSAREIEARHHSIGQF